MVQGGLYWTAITIFACIKNSEDLPMKSGLIYELGWADSESYRFVGYGDGWGGCVCFRADGG